MKYINGKQLLINIYEYTYDNNIYVNIFAYIINEFIFVINNV